VPVFVDCRSSAANFHVRRFLARPGIWLDDLFVDEDARENGVGAALLTELARVADRNGFARIEWVTAVDNAKGLAFYRRNGAQVHDTVRVLRLGRAELSHLARAGAI
jgi:GNAT superfamily N-acetyltransferase